MWEALAILVALRTWWKHWRGRRVALTIKSDIVSALVMAGKLKLTSSTLTARELSLFLSEAAFMPRHIEHVPGALNTWPESLSRLWDPNEHHAVPSSLQAVPRARTARRGASFYSTLAF